MGLRLLLVCYCDLCAADYETTKVYEGARAQVQVMALVRHGTYL